MAPTTAHHLLLLLAAAAGWFAASRNSAASPASVATVRSLSGLTALLHSEARGLVVVGRCTDAANAYCRRALEVALDAAVSKAPPPAVALMAPQTPDERRAVGRMFARAGSNASATMELALACVSAPDEDDNESGASTALGDGSARADNDDDVGDTDANLPISDDGSDDDSDDSSFLAPTVVQLHLLPLPRLDGNVSAVRAVVLEALQQHGGACLTARFGRTAMLPDDASGGNALWALLAGAAAAAADSVWPLLEQVGSALLWMLEPLISGGLTGLMVSLVCGNIRRGGGTCAPGAAAAAAAAADDTLLAAELGALHACVGQAAAEVARVSAALDCMREAADERFAALYAQVLGQQQADGAPAGDDARSDGGSSRPSLVEVPNDDDGADNDDDGGAAADAAAFAAAACGAADAGAALLDTNEALPAVAVDGAAAALGAIVPPPLGAPLSYEALLPRSHGAAAVDFSDGGARGGGSGSNTSVTLSKASSEDGSSRSSSSAQSEWQHVGGGDNTAVEDTDGNEELAAEAEVM